MNQSNYLINKIQNYKYKHLEILNLIKKYDNYITYFCLIISFISLVDYELKLFGIINNRFKHICIGLIVVLIMIYRHYMFNTIDDHNIMIERYRRIETNLIDKNKDYEFYDITLRYQFDESTKIINKTTKYLIFNKYKKFD
jgi:hypothetical protein